MIKSAVDQIVPSDVEFGQSGEIIVSVQNIFVHNDNKIITLFKPNQLLDLEVTFPIPVLFFVNVTHLVSQADG